MTPHAAGQQTTTTPPPPHAVCVPFPAQSHIKATLKLAKLLHSRGFHVTFVNTEFNHNRFLNTRGPHALDGEPNFRFAAIPDGLPPSDPGATQDVPAMCDSVMNHMAGPFRELVEKLNDENDGWPPVSCVVADGMMVFALEVGKEIGVPTLSYWTFAGCGLMGFRMYRPLVDRGVTPFKDDSYLTNGFLDKAVEVPGMKNMRYRDLPTFIQTTDPNEPIFHNLMLGAESVPIASALLVHTFHALEPDVLAALESTYPATRVYSVGPMQLLLNQIEPKSSHLDSIGYSLWQEEPQCLSWLDSKPPNSVLYVNFGSVMTMSKEHLIEFAMGFVTSNVSFLWVIRPDLVTGESAALPPEFRAEMGGNGFVSGWCPQEEVLNHPSVGGFLTHCGWGSTIETLTAGVPVLCWPFFADQQTNCRFLCTEWGIGMEIDKDVKRKEVVKLVRKLIEGEKGTRMRTKARKWAELAREATGPGGSSTVHLDRLINEVLLRK